MVNNELQRSYEEEVIDFLEQNWWNHTRSDEVFVPDDWSISMMVWVINQILEILEFKGKFSFLEVGIWTWIIIKYFLSNFRSCINNIVWLDIVPEAVNNAKENLTWLDADNVCTLEVSNLLKDFNWEILKCLDFMYACLPQVKFLWKEEEKPADFFAHYYEWDEFLKLEFDKFGLWLNEQTIIEAKKKSPELDILLNLAWRIPKNILFEMFENHWYSPKIMYEKIIPQHNWTDLRMFVDLEKKWLCTCEFFEDEDGKIKINAQEAEERSRMNKLVCHKIYVVKWIPKKAN